VSCCNQCQGIEDMFDPKEVAKDLRKYREKGPSKGTRLLLDALKAEGVQDATVLDIGGGVGAVQHALLEAGAAAVVNVDASTAYSEAAQEEARRRRLHDRVTYHHGNFVDITEELGPADIVTLDRVICCYRDVKALVGLSSTRAAELYGLVYPRDNLLSRAFIRVSNLYLRLTGSKFRAFVHPNALVENLLTANGLERRYYKKTTAWQVAVCGR